MSNECVLLNENQVVVFEKEDDVNRVIGNLAKYFGADTRQIEKVDLAGDRIFVARKDIDVKTKAIMRQNVSVFCKKADEVTPTVKKFFFLESNNSRIVTFSFGEGKIFDTTDDVYWNEEEKETHLGIAEALSYFFYTIKTVEIYVPEKTLLSESGINQKQFDDFSFEIENSEKPDFLYLLESQYPKSMFIFACNKVQKTLDIFFKEEASNPNEDIEYRFINGDSSDQGDSSYLGDFTITNVPTKNLRTFNFMQMFT